MIKIMIMLLVGIFLFGTVGCARRYDETGEDTTRRDTIEARDDARRQRDRRE